MPILLKNKILVSLITFFACSVVLVSFVSLPVSLGLEKEVYFSAILSDWEVSTKNINHKVLGIPDSLENSFHEGQDVSSDSGFYTLVITSDYNFFGENQDFLKTTTQALVICDETAVFDDLFSCGYNFTQINQAKVFDYQQISLSNTLTAVYRIDVLDTALIIIPEENFTIPEKRKVLEDAIKLLNLETSDLEPLGYKKMLGTLTTEPLFELFTYVVQLLILGLIFKGILSKLSKDWNELLDLTEWERGLNNFLDGYEKVRPFVIYVVTVGFIVLLPLFYVLSLRDTGEFSFTYMAGYLADTFSPSNLGVYVYNNQFFRILLFIYMAFLSVVGFTIFIPDLINFVLVSGKKIFNYKLTVSGKRLSYVVFAAVILFSFIGFVEHYQLFVLILLLFAYLLSLEFKEILGFIDKVTVRRKLLMLIAVFVVFCLSFVYRKIQYDFKYPEKKELFGVFESEVLLPFEKSLRPLQIFKPFLVDRTAPPIFVDEYMVYHPAFTKITNKNIEFFRMAGSYILVENNSDDVNEALVKNSELVTALTQPEFSSRFIVTDFEFDANTVYSGVISVDCSRSRDPFIATVEVYAENYHDRQAFSYFPGCGGSTFQSGGSVTSSSIEELLKYNVILDYSYVPDGTVVFDISDAESLVDFELFAGDTKLEKVNLIDGQGRKIIAKTINDTQELYVYSGDVLDEGFEVELSDEFDISEPINELKLDNLLDNPFTVWSTMDQIILQRKEL